MVKLGDLIPEKMDESVNVTMDTDDGMVVVKMDGREVLNVTHGDGKLLLLILMEAFGKKFAKQLMKVKLNWEDN